MTKKVLLVPRETKANRRVRGNEYELESKGTAEGFVRLAVFLTGLALSLTVFSLIVAESMVFCLLKLLVTVAELVFIV